LTLTLALLSTACANGRKPVYPVRGKVFVEGKPAAKALVTFHPVADKSPETIRPVGEVDDQGQFTLTTYANGDGAPEGEYEVAISWLLATRASRSTEDFYTKNYLPERYSRADSSGLRATIRKGENDLEPFELKWK
jgi:hypothetical protein